jgi:hypothetical protein
VLTLYSQVPSAGHVWAGSGTSVSLLIAEIMTQACVTLQTINQGEEKVCNDAVMDMKQLFFPLDDWWTVHRSITLVNLQPDA